MEARQTVTLAEERTFKTTSHMGFKLLWPRIPSDEILDRCLVKNNHFDAGQKLILQKVVVAETALD